MRRDQWTNTLSAWMHDLKHASGQQRMWAKSVCLMIMDAIDGPTDADNPPWDQEGDVSQSRAVSRWQIETKEDMYCVACICAGISPDALSDAFRAGLVDRGHAEGVFRRLTPD